MLTKLIRSSFGCAMVLGAITLQTGFAQSCCQNCSAAAQSCQSQASDTYNACMATAQTQYNDCTEGLLDEEYTCLYVWCPQHDPDNAGNCTGQCVEAYNMEMAACAMGLNSAQNGCSQAEQGALSGCSQAYTSCSTTCGGC
jgi:hypothetical protein